MFKPLISIIIPVLNGAEFLINCFKSIDEQNYDNLDIIFVDNNSSDKSKNLITAYCKERKNSRFFICKKQGVSAARNFGLNESRGQYISFLDVDDEIFPEKFNILMDVFEKNPEIGMAIGDTYKIYKNGKKHRIDYGHLKVGLNKWPKPGLLWLDQFQHSPHISSNLIKKEIIKGDIKFPEKLNFGEDIAFSIKIGLNNNIYYCDKLVSFYNRHSKSTVSISNTKVSKSERYLQFYEKFALQYFFQNRQNIIFQNAFNKCEKVTYDLFHKLLKEENKIDYFNNLNDLIVRGLLKPDIIQRYLYKIFSYKYANYLYFKLNDLKVKFYKSFRDYD